MGDGKLPLIHKAPIEGIAVHVARAGLSIGETVRLERVADGRIGVFAKIRRPVLGFFLYPRERVIGYLGQAAEEIAGPSLDEGDALRVRIVDLLPEYLAGGGRPEVHVSVWGDPRHLLSLWQHEEERARTAPRDGGATGDAGDAGDAPVPGAA